MRERVTLVTGVSKGIGRAVADHLLDRGHRVVGLARTPPASGYRGEFHAVDLADHDTTAAVLAEVTDRHAIDGLVNNAGLGIGTRRLEDMRPADLERLVAINLTAAMLCAQACLPAMKRKGFGRIVNIGSRGALGKVGRSGYGATKGAIASFTRNWALELAEHNITVNCVAPGPIETELFRRSNPPDDPRTRAILDGVPLKRVGQPREVAAAVAYFLSEDAGFTTGQVLYVCGGLTVGLGPL